MGFVYVAAASTSHVARGSNVAVFPRCQCPGQASPPAGPKAQAPAQAPAGRPPRHATGRRGLGPARIATTHGGDLSSPATARPAGNTTWGKLCWIRTGRQGGHSGSFSLPPPNNYQPVLFRRSEASPG